MMSRSSTYLCCAALGLTLGGAFGATAAWMWNDDGAAEAIVGDAASTNTMLTDTQDILLSAIGYGITWALGFTAFSYCHDQLREADHAPSPTLGSQA